LALVLCRAQFDTYMSVVHGARRRRPAGGAAVAPLVSGNSYSHVKSDGDGPLAKVV
jgi:hypothetical protein